MFSIFSMRRPNILPVGTCYKIMTIGIFLTSFAADMGVQRGVLRWFLSLHSPSYKITISPEKADSPEDRKVTTETTPKTKAKGKGKKAKAKEVDALPVFDSALTGQPEGIAEDLSSVPPGPASRSIVEDVQDDGEDGTLAEIASMPALFTPSINKTLQKGSKLPTSLPDGMTVATLRSRLDPKKRGKK
jgi:DNA-3-methyladenine glycosylase II